LDSAFLGLNLSPAFSGVAVAKGLMPPKAAEPSMKKFVFLEVVKMVFSISEPSKEEILSVRRLAKYNPEDLDSRELWVLEHAVEGDEDD